VCVYVAPFYLTFCPPKAFRSLLPEHCVSLNSGLFREDAPDSLPTILERFFPSRVLTIVVSFFTIQSPLLSLFISRGRAVNFPPSGKCQELPFVFFNPTTAYLYFFAFFSPLDTDFPR